MTEPQSPDNLESVPTVDLRDIIIEIRHNLHASSPWAWGNTGLETAPAPADTAPGHEVDVGPAPEI
jgi:hypothetical protein